MAPNSAGFRRELVPIQRDTVLDTDKTDEDAMTPRRTTAAEDEKRGMPADWIVLTLGLMAMGLSAAFIAASGSDAAPTVSEGCISAECANR
ncbi:MAG: hypothetical protein ACU0DW_09360 [Shimia sp.]